MVSISISIWKFQFQIIFEFIYRTKFTFFKMISLIFHHFWYFVTGAGVFGTRHFRSSGQVLEARYQRYCRNQNSKKSSILCTSRSNWSLDFVTSQPRECRWIQFCPCIRVFSTQKPYMFGVWNARTELVWFFETK